MASSGTDDQQHGFDGSTAMGLSKDDRENEKVDEEVESKLSTSSSFGELQNGDTKENEVTNISEDQMSNGELSTSGLHESLPNKSMKEDEIIAGATNKLADGNASQFNSIKDSQEQNSQTHTGREEQATRIQPSATKIMAHEFYEMKKMSSSEVSALEDSPAGGTSREDTPDPKQAELLEDVSTSENGTSTKQQSPEEDHQDKHANEVSSSSIGTGIPALLINKVGASQYGTVNGIMNLATGTGTVVGNDPNTVLAELLPTMTVLGLTILRTESIWLDRAEIFIWSIFCICLVMLTINMAHQLNWNFESLVTAVPIFDHPQGVFKSLNLNQAKGVDFTVSAVLAPLVIGYANYIWFRTCRRLSRLEVGEPSTNTSLSTANFDAGTYDLGKLLGILRVWSVRNLLFVVLLISSALAYTLLSNVLAYEAIPGSDNSIGDRDAMYYHMVYIPAILFFALCSVTVATIAALLLVFDARRAAREKKLRLTAASLGLSLEEYKNSREHPLSIARRQFVLWFPALPRFSLPAWKWQRYGNAEELEPLLPESTNATATQASFSAWKMPQIRMPHFALSSGSGNHTDLESQIPIIKTYKGKETQQDEDSGESSEELHSNDGEFDDSALERFDAAWRSREELRQIWRACETIDVLSTTFEPTISRNGEDMEGGQIIVLSEEESMQVLQQYGGGPNIVAEQKVEMENKSKPLGWAFGVDFSALTGGWWSEGQTNSKGKGVSRNIEVVADEQHSIAESDPESNSGKGKGKARETTIILEAHYNSPFRHNLLQAKASLDAKAENIVPEESAVAVPTKESKQEYENDYEREWGNSGWTEPPLLDRAVSETQKNDEQGSIEDSKKSMTERNQEQGSSSSPWRWSGLRNSPYPKKRTGARPAWDFGEWGDVE